MLADSRNFSLGLPLPGELGLDGKSRVPMEEQVETLFEAFDVLRQTPRLTSLHSYAATGQLLEVLEAGSPPGIILHWWLGDAQQTRRAVELGCYFSVNASSVRRKDILASVPRDRLLTETDHPFGDRRSRPRRPGLVDDVEQALGHQHGMSPSEVRRLMWSNLRLLISTTGCSKMLPSEAESRSPPTRDGGLDSSQCVLGSKVWRVLPGPATSRRWFCLPST